MTSSTFPDLKSFTDFFEENKGVVATYLRDSDEPHLANEVERLPNSLESLSRAANSQLPVAAPALALCSISRILALVPLSEWNAALREADIALVLLGLPLANPLLPVIDSLSPLVTPCAVPDGVLGGSTPVAIDIPSGLDGACAALSDADLESFRPFFRADSPVVLKGYADKWPAVRKWSQPSFWNLFAARTVPVEYTAARDAEMQEQFWYLRDVLRLMLDGDPDGRCVYLAQHPLLEYIRELKTDVECPAVVKVAGEDVDVVSNMWMGCSESGSKLHFDTADNVLVQVVGRKTVVLIGSQFSKRLYRERGRRNVSRVDLANLDLKLFPKFDGVEGVCVELSPGDALYIPAGYWHWVKASTSSISVNFWF